MINCENNDFVAQVKEAIPGISTNELNKRKDQYFVKWLKTQV